LKKQKLTERYQIESGYLQFFITHVKMW